MDSNRIELIVTGRHEEGVAAESGILPGMLVQLTSDDELEMQDAAGAYCEIAVAKEDALQGKTIEDAYAMGDVVSYVLPNPGDEVAVLLKASENVVIGDDLIASGDGTVQKTTGSPLRVLFKAREASNVGTATLVRARVL